MESSFLKLLKTISKTAVDLVIPPVCLACHKRIEDQNEQILCPNCLETISVLSESICDKCGSPLSEDGCEFCWEFSPQFDISRSAIRYEGAAATLIQDLKYKAYIAIAPWLANVMTQFMDDLFQYQKFDFIMAVPLHRVRKRERGFNQSELIARHISSTLKIPYQEPVERSFYTASQTRLSKERRIKNLTSAFRLKRRANIQGKRILIVDDVFTTGSTLNEICKTLRTANPDYIATLTAARA